MCGATKAGGRTLQGGGGGGYRERGCVELRERMKERRRNGRRRRGGGGCWIVGWDEVDKGEAVDAVRRECAERERTGDNCQLVAAAAVADPSVIPSLVLSSVLAVVVDSLSSLDLSSGPPLSLSPKLPLRPHFGGTGKKLNKVDCKEGKKEI